MLFVRCSHTSVRFRDIQHGSAARCTRANDNDSHGDASRENRFSFVCFDSLPRHDGAHAVPRRRLVPNNSTVRWCHVMTSRPMTTERFLLNIVLITVLPITIQKRVQAETLKTVCRCKCAQRLPISTRYRRVRIRKHNIMLTSIQFGRRSRMNRFILFFCIIVKNYYYYYYYYYFVFRS
jgi:hypothetical protein